MTDIYIVRHGNTFDKGDTITRVGARTDLVLSHSGQAQAERLAVHFRDLVPSGFGAAFCSELKRTQQTAETILTAYPTRPELELLEFLREVDYGPDENLPEEKVIARIGEAALQAWDQRAVPPPGWIVSPDHLIAEWASLLHKMSGPSEGQPDLIVTSNGVARFVLNAVTNVQCPMASIKLKTGAYGRVRASRDGATLLDWNVRP